MSKAIDKIKNVMEDERWTQTQLAEKLGMSKQSMNQMLGKDKDIKAEKWIEIADAMGFDVVMIKRPVTEKSKFY